MTDIAKKKRGIRNLRLTPHGLGILRQIERGTYKFAVKGRNGKRDSKGRFA